VDDAGEARERAESLTPSGAKKSAWPGPERRR
jgi:hypothetical protein